MIFVFEITKISKMSKPVRKNVPTNESYSDMSIKQLWEHGLKLGLISEVYAFKNEYEKYIYPATLIKYLNNCEIADEEEKLELRIMFMNKFKATMKADVSSTQKEVKTSSFRHKRINVDYDETNEEVKRNNEVQRNDRKYPTPTFKKEMRQRPRGDEIVSKLKKLWNVAQNKGLIDNKLSFTPIYYSFITPDEMSHLLDEFVKGNEKESLALSNKINTEIKSFMLAKTYTNDIVQIDESYKNVLSKAIKIGLLDDIQFSYTMSKIVSLAELTSYVTVWLDMSSTNENVKNTLKEHLTSRFERGLNQVAVDNISYKALIERGKESCFFDAWIDKYAKDLESFMSLSDLRNLFKTLQYLTRDDEIARRKRFYSIFVYYLNSVHKNQNIDYFN